MWAKLSYKFTSGITTNAELNNLLPKTPNATSNKLYNWVFKFTS